MLVHTFKLGEIAVEIAPSEFAERGIVARESDAHDRESPSFERMSEQIQLRAFARAVDSLERNQFSAWCHELDFSLTCEAHRRKEVPHLNMDSSARVLKFAR